MKRFLKIVLAVLIPVLAVSSFFLYLWIDYNNGVNNFKNLVNSNPGALQGFQQLASVTPAGAVIYSWWDYGHSIQGIGGRIPIVKYPSKDILNTVGNSRTVLGSLEEQLFSPVDPSDKVHDVARGFLLPENQSLTIMQKYGATYVMVFTGDVSSCCWDIGKFSTIAGIAGYNPTAYLTVGFNSTTRQPTFKLTPQAGNVTILRLLFDKEIPPQHFTKIYDNNVTKIYKINYPGSLQTMPSYSKPAGIGIEWTTLPAGPTSHTGSLTCESTNAHRSGPRCLYSPVSSSNPKAAKIIAVMAEPTPVVAEI